MTPNRVGQHLGNYRLLRFLGRGSFGDVYLGEHEHEHTMAAVKVVQARLTAEDLKEFINETSVTFRLKHPNIAQLLDFGVSADGTPFLVMAYAANGTLRQRHLKGTRLPLEMIVSYVKQVAAALQYAHDKRLIHRDVKPENILLGPNNEVWLSDFGIASVAHSSRSLNTERSGGTVPYMAPEQIQGKPRPASDQYALGIIAYEWLCGERPFTGTAIEIAMQHALTPPPSLRGKGPTISVEVEQVVMTALAKDPKQRFASVQSFATALEQARGAAQRPFSAGRLPVPVQPVSSQPPPPVVSQNLSALIPTLPPSQEVPIAHFSPTAFTPTGRPERDTLSSKPNSAPPPSRPTQQPATPIPSKPPSRRTGLSRYKVVFLIVLVLLIVGSAGLLYNSVSTYNTHVQATATALAPIRAYETFVAAHGIMFGVDATHTRSNPYEHILSPATVSGLTQGWTYPAVGSISTDPVVANGIIYFGSLDKSLYALDARSHSIRWNFQTGGAVESTPAVVNGVVYVGSYDHSVYALDARTGHKLWSFATGDRINSSPAVTSGVVYVGSWDRSVYALDARTGRKLWSFATRDRIFSSPAVAGGVVYVGSYDKSLYALDARTGRKLWSFATGNSISSSPVVANGVVYVGSDDGRLYTFHLK